MLDDWFDTEILTSPMFWIPMVVSGAVLWYVLNSWVGEVRGTTGFAVMGGIAIVVFSYFWAARKMDSGD